MLRDLECATHRHWRYWRKNMGHRSGRGYIDKWWCGPVNIERGTFLNEEGAVVSVRDPDGWNRIEVCDPESLSEYKDFVSRIAALCASDRVAVADAAYRESHPAKDAA
jgi:hypothetical protein